DGRCFPWFFGDLHSDGHYARPHRRVEIDGGGACASRLMARRFVPHEPVSATTRNTCCTTSPQRASTTRSSSFRTGHWTPPLRCRRTFEWSHPRRGYRGWCGCRPSRHGSCAGLVPTSHTSPTE